MSSVYLKFNVLLGDINVDNLLIYLRQQVARVDAIVIKSSKHHFYIAQDLLTVVCFEI